MNEKYIENTNKNSINHNINETSNDSFSNLQKKTLKKRINILKSN